MKLYTIQGTKFFFWGKNNLGWWMGINFVPGKFGILLDVGNSSMLSWLKSKVQS